MDRFERAAWRLERLSRGQRGDHTARQILDERYARGDTPEAIRQRRYARGKIGREEYEQVRRDIKAE